VRVALDDLAGRGPRVYELAGVQWNETGLGPHLRRGDAVFQRFHVQSDGLAEVHVRLEHFSDRCFLDATVFVLEGNGGKRARVGGGVMPCSNEPFQVIPVDRQPHSAGRTYEIELKTAQHDAPVTLFHTSPVPSRFVPLRESGEPSAEPKVLAFRVVVDAP
jgi:hypothetical protein